MAMRPTPNGWSDAVSKSLPTYTGKPCPSCGCTTKSTINKNCVNKCYLERARKYKSQCREIGKMLEYKPRIAPEKQWQMLKPDFRQDNIQTCY